MPGFVPATGRLLFCTFTVANGARGVNMLCSSKSVD
jgi:hypothetical protein